MFHEHLSEHELETILIAVHRALVVAQDSGEKVTRENIAHLRDQAVMELIEDEHAHSLDSWRVLIHGSGVVAKMQEFIATGKWA